MCVYVCQYGKQLYINFQEAMRRSEAAYDWSSLSSSSIKSGSSSSSLPGLSVCLSEVNCCIYSILENTLRSKLIKCCYHKMSVKVSSFCVPSHQSPSPTSPANQTVVCQRWHHQATLAPRVLSAPSSLMPGGEEHKERYTHTHTILSFSCHCPGGFGLYLP